MGSLHELCSRIGTMNRIPLTRPKSAPSPHPMGRGWGEGPVHGKRQCPHCWFEPLVTAKKLEGIAASKDDDMRMNARTLLWDRDQPSAVARTSSRDEGMITRLMCFVSAALSLLAGGVIEAESTVDLAGATVVIRSGKLPNAEQAATQVLVEELEKRIGKRLPVSTSWPKDGLVVVVTSGPAEAAWGHAIASAGRRRIGPRGGPRATALS